MSMPTYCLKAIGKLAMAAFCAIVLFPPIAQAQLPAFPGAEGEAMWTAGGRGGNVYHVTNLNNSGAGSLREAVSTGGTAPRTVVFDVSGTIPVTSKLRITRPNITIAGQTAPGMGIVIRNFGTSVQASNVVVQHLRFRPGDAYKGLKPLQYDFALAVSGQNVMIDHISASWSISQIITVNGSNFNDVTIQNSIIGEALDQTGIYHNTWNDDYLPGGSKHHANGLFVKPLSGGSGTFYATAHHNLLVDNYGRNPCPGVYNSSQSMMFDFRNNVIHNCQNSGYNSGGAGGWINMNYVGNYLIAGPNTSDRYRLFDGWDGTDLSIYQTGNLVDPDRDSSRDGYDRGWNAFEGTYTKLTSPAAMEPVTTQSAEDAYDNVLAQAGAFWWNRDSVDTRLVNDVINNTGGIIDSQDEVGGYPVIPVEYRPTGFDTDMDGMPSYWEVWYGTGASSADNTGLGAGGYTHLEQYLQWLTDPATVYHFGDINGDNHVYIGELSIMAAYWNQVGAYEQGDFNGDGTVSIGDLSILAAQWGWTWSGGPLVPPASVPEPVTLSLLALGGLVGLRRRGR